MATTNRRRMIREASSSVQGRSSTPERSRTPIARSPSPPSNPPSKRVANRGQPQSGQGGPKLNELRGKIAKLERERVQIRDAALEELDQIEALLGHLTLSASSVVFTAMKANEIRTRCEALRKVLG